MAQSILCYGQTGSFKTSNAAEYVEWIYDRYHGITRGIFGDNFGPARTQINDGLLDAWDITGEVDPLACVILASEGYWPEKIVDGRPVAVAPSKTPRLIKDNFKGVGGYLIEGFKENADLFHRMLERKRQATGEPLAGEHSSAAYGQNVLHAVSSRGTYGFAQAQTHRYFKLGFKGLPVPWVMATSHEYGNRKEGIYGVAVSGKSLAKVVPQWFDHTLHFVKVEVVHKIAVSGKTITITRDGSEAWFANHKVDNIKWPAKLGVEPWLMEEIYQTWPGGFVPLLTAGRGAEFKYISSIRNLLEMIDPGPEPEPQGVA